AMAGDDGPAIFFSSEMLRPLDGSALLHRIGQINAFHGADFGKTSASNHIATGFCRRFGRFLSLVHVRNLARIAIDCSMRCSARGGARRAPQPTPAMVKRIVSRVLYQGAGLAFGIMPSCEFDPFS